MKKKTIILTSMFVVLAAAAATAFFVYMQYRNQLYKKIKEQALEIAVAMENGDMSKITNIVFGTEDLEIDEELEKEFRQTNDIAEDGILKEIFKRNTIKVKKIEYDTIEYEVESPNLEIIFQKLQEQKTKMTQEEIKDYLKSYIGKAKKKKRTAVVSYSEEDGVLKADYKSEAFINAITGGLAESYKVYYQELLKTYKEGLGE